MALTQVPIELSSTPGIVDNSNATAITIDSSENVGIGTTSPSATLEVASGSGNTDAGTNSPTIRITNDTQSADWDAGDVVGTLEFQADDTSGNAPYDTSFIKSVNDISNGTLPSGALTFGTATYNAAGGAVERLRIDSSGNLLVGKTSASTNTVGVEARADGTFSAVKSGGGAVVFGRNTDDGTIVTLRKDGTAVGSIQSRAGVVSTIILDPRTNGAGLTGSTNGLIPVNQAGSTADNHVDLGSSSSRFKDLYLSGGAYLGGTAAVNKLDDYEEGTWTPTAGISLTVNYANYIKIGSLVYINVDVEAASGSSSGSAFQISLPFASVATYQAGAFSYQTSGFTDATVNITTGIGFRTTQTGSNMTFTQAQGKRFIFSATYKTSA